MLNPFKIFQVMRGGNPQQIISQMINNNQIMQNPMAQNAVNMAQNGDAKGIEQLARNLCKEKGLNPDEIFNQVKNNFGM